MKTSKEELCTILGIKQRTLKDIEHNNQLENRLENKGYKYINKYKEGKKVFYEIELINENKEVYSNMCKYVYNVNKEDEFSKYFTTRTLSNSNKVLPLNCADISEVAKVSSKTVRKWDATLELKDIIRKDGFYYFSMELETRKIEQCSKEEYLSFWKNKALLSALGALQRRYINGEITLTELQLASMDIGTIITTIKGKYYFKSKKYITNSDNELYNDTIKLIANLYGNNKNTYSIELEE